MSPSEHASYPGHQWDIPATGPGSVAGMGKRFVSLLVDWGVASLGAGVAFNGDPLATLIIFALHNIILTTLFGASIGQGVLGLRVSPVSGQSPMLVRAILRTALILMVLPPLIVSNDKQGLQDVASGCAVTRVR